MPIAINPGDLSDIDTVIKSHLFTQISLPGDTNFEPVAFGSGFFVKIDDLLVFVTADHNLHLEDYNPSAPPTGEEFNIGIFNNYDIYNPNLSTVITPTGGYYHFTLKCDFSPNGDFEAKPADIDVAACVIGEKQQVYPFLIPKYRDKDGKMLPREDVVCFTEQSLAMPKPEDKCLVHGHVKFDISSGINLKYESIIHRLTFKSVSNNILFFNSATDIDIELWKGLSGSPIIDSNGMCVGVLTSVFPGSRSVWGVSINMVRNLLKIIQIENPTSTH